MNREIIQGSGRGELEEETDVSQNGEGEAEA